jgi:NhaP-type Na+/H+ and K+/H+ antiporter
MVLALALALLARPLVVLLTLGLARLSWAERAFITWSGLKGAVSILLAALALLGGVAGTEHVYGVVFVVVLVSVVGQGALVPFVARVREILPNLAAPIVVYATLVIPQTPTPPSTRAAPSARSSASHSARSVSRTRPTAASACAR